MAKINSRAKGAAFERWVVNQFKAAGYHAVRTAPMQAGHPQHAADVEVYDREGGKLIAAVECKAWAKQPSDAQVSKAVDQAEEHPRADWMVAVVKQNQRAPFVAFRHGYFDEAQGCYEGIEVRVSFDGFLRLVKSKDPPSREYTEEAPTFATRAVLDVVKGQVVKREIAQETDRLLVPHETSSDGDGC